MGLTEIKKAIIQRLQPLRTRVRIVADDSQGEAGSNAEVKSDYTIRVSYSSGNFNPPVTQQGFGFQQGTRSFEISIEIRDLRNEDKAVALMEDIEGLIIGYCPCVAGVDGEFYLVSDRFVRASEGIYFYSISVSIPINYG